MVVRTCENWIEKKKPELCMQCYWGSPENYNHIALKDIRRLDMYWTGDEVKYYHAIKIIAEENKIQLPEFIKKIIVGRARNKNE